MNLRERLEGGGWENIVIMSVSPLDFLPSLRHVLPACVSRVLPDPDPDAIVNLLERSSQRDLRPGRATQRSRTGEVYTL